MSLRTQEERMLDWAMANNGEMPPEFRDMLDAAPIAGAA